MLLTGPPASAKNMMMKIIEGHEGKQRVYFADGATTRKQVFSISYQTIQAKRLS